MKMYTLQIRMDKMGTPLKSTTHLEICSIPYDTCYAVLMQRRSWHLENFPRLCGSLPIPLIYFWSVSSLRTYENVASNGDDKN